MRKEYRKAVRELFSRGLLQALPGFEPVKVKALVLFGGETVFRWAASDQLHCFVILAPDPKGRQSFTIELAWSTAGRFPEATSRPTLMLGAEDPDPTDLDEGIVRLGDIADRRDTWWNLPDPALDRPGDMQALQKSLEPIEPELARTDAERPVEAALQVMTNTGVRFFEKLAELRCDESVSPRHAN